MSILAAIIQAIAVIPMPEYHAIRLVLGAFQLALGISLIRRKLGYLLWFSVFLVWSGTINIAPAFPYSEGYKHWVQVPSTLIALVLLIAATLDVFRFLPRRTFPQERERLATFSLIVGLVPVATGWLWSPENWYQAVMIGRQYVLLGVAVAFWAAWLYLFHFRPLSVPSSVIVRAQGTLWGMWLVSSGILATTTKGGLLWQLHAWADADLLWRATTDSCLLHQAVVVWLFWVNLRKVNVATQAEKPYLSYLGPSLLDRQ